MKKIRRKGIFFPLSLLSRLIKLGQRECVCHQGPIRPCFFFELVANGSLARKFKSGVIFTPMSVTRWFFPALSVGLSKNLLRQKWNRQLAEQLGGNNSNVNDLAFRSLDPEKILELFGNAKNWWSVKLPNFCRLIRPEWKAWRTYTLAWGIYLSGVESKECTSLIGF